MYVEFGGLRFGFFCSTADGKLTTNRKFRLKNLSIEKVLKTVDKNLKDFKALLNLSISMGMSIFRLGSDIVPFASHKSFKREWLRPVEYMLLEFSKTLKKYPIRITTHPGQFVVLNSPREEVLSASLRELEYHFWVLDTLGVGEEGVVVIHGGGVYKDKNQSLNRLKGVLKKHPWLKGRIAIENDEKHYTVRDLLDAELDVPVVYDHYHHSLNPSDFEPKEVLDTWKGKVPEFHLSSKPKRAHIFGEHGDWVELEDFLGLYKVFGESRADIIVEAKMKEKAVEKLIKDIYLYLHDKPGGNPEGTGKARGLPLQEGQKAFIHRQG
ncbi:MAG: UV DNA damage repair endonuclease UvsE [Acidobacteria bacterium]|nr:MAG: UV DNA damage repair endonuclease UvsE [Acidobacteriota bacterium]